MTTTPKWKEEQVAPFDPETGSLLNSPGESLDILWLDVSEPFYAQLQCTGYSSSRKNVIRGRSMRYHWTEVAGSAMYQMFIEDHFNMWSEGLLGDPKKIVKGWWKVVKKGQYYGIKFVGRKKIKTGELLDNEEITM